MVAVEVTNEDLKPHEATHGIHKQDGFQYVSYHITEKRTDLRSARHEPCWSWCAAWLPSFTCLITVDTLPSSLDCVWPLIPSLDLILTLTFGLTFWLGLRPASSSQTCLIVWTIGWTWLPSPGWSFLPHLGVVGWALASEAPCPASHGICLGSPSPRESWLSPCPDTYTEAEILLSLYFPFIG